jgi:hypothetical protein
VDRSAERDRLAEIVDRQDKAIDQALEAFARLAKTGSLRKDVREAARQRLLEARNERIQTDG